MDKLQKVLNEVERLQNELIKEKKKGNGSDVDDACILTLQNIKNYIKFVQEEPVSEDLEKAAIDICSKVLKGETIIIDGYEYVVLSDAEECFKAGVKWQKRQMMKDAVNVVIGNEWGHPRCVLTQYDLEPLGIRGKDKVKVIVIKED